jgi:hypothetical protein
MSGAPKHWAQPRSSPNPGRRRRRSDARQCLCMSPRRPGSAAFPGATAATLGPEREEASRVGSSAADPDECLVAEALVRRSGARLSKRSCGPRQPDARVWAIASARRDREILSSARLILVISKRVSDLSADPPDACSRVPDQLTRPRRPSPAIAAERHSGRRPRPRCWYYSKPGVCVSLLLLERKHKRRVRPRRRIGRCWIHAKGAAPTGLVSCLQQR